MTTASDAARLCATLKGHLDRAGACLDDTGCPRSTARTELVAALAVLDDLTAEIG